MTSDIAAQGILDARNDIKKSDEAHKWFGITFSLSVLSVGIIGSFAVVGSQYYDTAPPIDKLIGKTPEYVLAYTDTYIHEIRKKRLFPSVVGCTIGSGVSWAILTTFVVKDVGLIPF